MLQFSEIVYLSARLWGLAQGVQMRSWTKLLPFFVVVWLARRWCSRVHVEGRVYVQPFGPGEQWKPVRSVFIEVDVRDREYYRNSSRVDKEEVGQEEASSKL